MQLTPELAATSAQIIPTFAIAALVLYNAQTRSIKRLSRPLIETTKLASLKAIDLKRRGATSREIVEEVFTDSSLDIGPADIHPWRMLWAFALSGLVAIVVIFNAASELLCLAALGGDRSADNGTGNLVFGSMLAAIILLLIAPVAFFPANLLSREHFNREIWRGQIILWKAAASLRRSAAKERQLDATESDSGA